MNRYQLAIVLFVAVLVLVIVRVANGNPAHVAGRAEASEALRTAPVSSAREARAVIRAVFGDRASAALRVASCETGGTFDSRALGSAGERGLFQVHPVHFGRLDESRLFEPLYNARFAFRLSHGGTDWSAWSCRP